MKDLFPIIFKEIKSSWFAKQKDVDSKKVIVELKKMEHLSKSEFLKKISKMPYVLNGAQLHEWNLYAIAWRIVERSMDYPYQKGDVIVFGGRTATIKSVRIKERSAELMNGNLVPLSSIRMKEPLLEPEQLTLF
ncbi:hypothetical protein [Peribacillus frigoritolerans]|uniref:hypothetical protein n=1 Tax=Peribacillus frigoritolerans TaxID=450367 RepID=UPI00399EF487